MKFKTPLLSVAAAAIALSAVTVASSPAQAAIAFGSSLNLASPIGGGVSTSLTSIDFFGPIPPQNIAITGGSGSFDFGVGVFPPQPITNLLATNITGQVKDVTLAGGNFAGLLANFISGINTRPLTGLAANQVSFDLTKFIFDNVEKKGDFSGVIRKGTDFSAAIGQFTTQNIAGATSYSITVTAVPTPALLPGLIGLGMGVLRKRKKEMAEAVGAEA